MVLHRQAVTGTLGRMSLLRSLLFAAAGGALVACGAGSAEEVSPRAPEPVATVVTTPEPTSGPTPEPTSSPAEELLAATEVSLRRWVDVTVAEADGYRSVGDGFTGYEHFFHPLWAVNGETLNPERPESLVYRVTPRGHELVSAMYVLPPGSTMADVPDLGDPRATWHTHDDLCFDTDGRLAGRLVDGACAPGGIHLPTPPMLHVWIVVHPCGPFAGIEGHGDACPEHDHAH